MTIGELAARSGVAPSALRFYEAEGLIRAGRTSGNQRRYERAMLRRIALVQAGRAAGIPLAGIRAALDTLPSQRTPSRRAKPRRVVLLLDVSGSMSEHALPLVAAAHAALRQNRRWEVFCFATRLTRLTRALAEGDPDEALRRAAAEVVDWHGGTRIGECLGRFLDEHGHAGMARGALVVVCSDGFDVGDPELLRAQMERLSRLAHRVVWLNPLKADPAYEPLARGMQAALPYVDDFASGHNLASLEALAEHLSG